MPRPIRLVRDDEALTEKGKGSGKDCIRNSGKKKRWEMRRMDVDKADKKLAVKIGLVLWRLCKKAPSRSSLTLVHRNYNQSRKMEKNKGRNIS